MNSLPIRIEAVRIGPQVGIVVDLPNGNLNISAGRDVKLTKLGVFSRLACHEQHHRWEEPQGLGKYLV
jgi:hypothetical protein